MSLTLNTVPGFCDQPSGVLDAGDPALGILLNRISQNANFGMARLEVFQGEYKDGDTVALPTSTIDGYVYGRDELLYVWALRSTANFDTHFLTGPGALWFCAWLVDQTTGDVSCVEHYRTSGSDSAKTSDGKLLVFTVGQRQMSSLTISSPPELSTHPDSDFAQDKPLTSLLLNSMSDSSKFSAVAAEVVYMGEFVHGDTVPLAVSPADGFEYERAQMKYVKSWRWTTGGAKFKHPDYADGQLHRISSHVDPDTGEVSSVVIYQPKSGLFTSSDSVVTNNGRIAVWAFCQRQGSDSLSEGDPVDVVAGDFPVMNDEGFLSSRTYVLQFKAASILTPFTGDFSVGFKAAADGDCHVDTVVLKRTLAGSTTVVDTVALGSNISIPAGTTVHTPAQTCSFDSSHDYYVYAYHNAGDNFSALAFTSNDTTADVCMFDNNGSGDLTGDTDVAAGKNGDTTWWLFHDLIFISSGSAADDFEEIPIPTFFPGEVLKASTMLQLEHNIKEAARTPEFFGPANYLDGDQVDLPVSPLDGYTYGRDELVYIWDFNKTSDPETGLRLAELVGHVDQDGNVSIHVWRLTGGSGYYRTQDGQLNILTIGMRSSVNDALDEPDEELPDGADVEDSDDFDTTFEVGS